ncbi:MAG: CarD family transcriptional regulator [Firmicutes bacterium]|nr:CarD family transcriptional regulator [Bacillota bacterium]
MFKLGDKIVYPMYGAGVIENIEDRIVDGEKELLYTVKIPVGNLTIIAAESKLKKFGIRRVSAADVVIDTIKNVQPIEMPDNWNIRYKENQERIKSGDLVKVMEVFKTLIFRERIKTLSSAEKKMLGNAKQIILSEIILSQEISKAEAEKLLISNCKDNAVAIA